MWIFDGARLRALLSRLTICILATSIVVTAAPTDAVGAQTPPPEDCENIESATSEIEGEVINREPLVDEFSTNIDRLTVRTDTASVQIEVDGKPELVEVGERYLFTVITIPTEVPTLITSAFGENLSCLTQPDPDNEDDPDALIPIEVGISLIDADGVATLIEEPPFLPSPPISTRSFFIGFGIFAVVIFLARFR